MSVAIIGEIGRLSDPALDATLLPRPSEISGHILQAERTTESARSAGQNNLLSSWTLVKSV